NHFENTVVATHGAGVGIAGSIGVVDVVFSERGISDAHARNRATVFTEHLEFQSAPALPIQIHIHRLFTDFYMQCIGEIFVDHHPVFAGLQEEAITSATIGGAAGDGAMHPVIGERHTRI